MGKNILKENENTFFPLTGEVLSTNSQTLFTPSSNFQNCNNSLPADFIYPSSSLSSEIDSSELEEVEEPLSDEESHLAFAKATIKFLGHRPEFAKKVKELKEKYNL